MASSQATILVVEDDDNDVALIKRAFRKAQVANPVIYLDDGEKAVAYLEGSGVYADRDRHPLPTLILLDLKLPRRGGLEVLSWIRARPELNWITVVILTGSKEKSDIARAYQLGTSSYLVKPVDFDDLSEMIGTLKLYWIIYNEKPRESEPS